MADLRGIKNKINILIKKDIKIESVKYAGQKKMILYVPHQQKGEFINTIPKMAIGIGRNFVPDLM